MKKQIILISLLLLGCIWVNAQNKPVDPGLETPRLLLNPIPEYDYHTLDYGMTIGIERTPNGRIWACWVGGGDNADAFFVLATSDDEGMTWSKPRLVIDPHDATLGERRSTIVGNLWTDPLGRLWLFFDQSMEYFDGRGGNWYTICENPDSNSPVWSEPVRIWHGCSLNKPAVMSDGTWVLPVSLWTRRMIYPKYKEAYPELDSLRLAHVFISTDQGKTWERRGGVDFPYKTYDEHHVIERMDGSWWMTARTTNGIHESISYDQGYTWTEPVKYLPQPSSRHFITRLQSGRLLLVKHGDIHQRTKMRSQLKAFLSEDDGKTWIGGLMLDERRGLSYPDGFQAPDGTIFISYDRNRETDGEILMARFTEEDILKGAFQSPKSRERMLISKPGTIEYYRSNNIK
ncbi:MAG: glycoside hydrolase [Tannerellaceae bacterium]|nr:glycoside hydrolase [Tannerellaceae bacterium]